MDLLKSKKKNNLQAMSGWDKYTKVKKIGSGAFGSAWLVKRKNDGMAVVCKEINVVGISPKEKENIFEEVDILKKLSHVNIVALHEAFTDGHNMNIMME